MHFNYFIFHGNDAVETETQKIINETCQDWRERENLQLNPLSVAKKLDVSFHISSVSLDNVYTVNNNAKLNFDSSYCTFIAMQNLAPFFNFII